jgi:hypothetical protein
MATEIELEPIENASRLMCGDHHHVDKLEECFPAKVSKWRNDLDGDGARRVINPRDFVGPFGCFRKAIQQRCDRRVRAGREEAFYSGVLFFTPCPCKVSHRASVNDRCALNA